MFIDFECCAEMRFSLRLTFKTSFIGDGDTKENRKKSHSPELLQEILTQSLIWESLIDF